MKRIILAVLAAVMTVGAAGSAEARHYDHGRYYGRHYDHRGWHRGWERRRAYYHHRYYYRHGRRYRR